MTVTCPRCQTRYEFATLRLRGKDRMATCGRCGHRFLVRLLKPGAAGATEATLAGVPRPGAAPAAARRIALTVLEGPQKDRVYRLGPGVTVIGRLQGEIRLADPRVSGRHAEVEVSGPEAWLRDLGSTNGTFVNGTRIDTRVRLNHLDEIAVGATRLLYTCFDDLAAAYEGAEAQG